MTEPHRNVWTRKRTIGKIGLRIFSVIWLAAFICFVPVTSTGKWGQTTLAVFVDAMWSSAVADTIGIQPSLVSIAPEEGQENTSLRAFRDKAIPLIETLTGSHFLKIPGVSLITKNELRNIIQDCLNESFLDLAILHSLGRPGGSSERRGDP